MIRITFGRVFVLIVILSTCWFLLLIFNFLNFCMRYDF